MISTISSAEVRRWVRATEGREISVGISPERALVLAGSVWGRLVDGGDVRELHGFGRNVVEVLHALVRILEDKLGDIPVQGALCVKTIYHLVSRNVELVGDVDERNALLASLSYRVWDICRRGASCPEMDEWAELCAGHVQAQEGNRDLLKLGASERSENVNARYLCDPPMLLAICRQLGRDKNRAPSGAAEEGASVFRWLTDRQPLRDLDEQAYFAGELALTVSGALGHMGRFREAEVWSDLSETWFRRTGMSAVWLPRVRFTNLLQLSRRHLPSRVIGPISSVLAELKRFGLPELFKCRLLEAVVLKDLERRTEALERLKSMRADPALREEPLLFGLVLVNMGEIAASLGDLDGGQMLLAEAAGWLVKADTPWAVANLQAVLGEMLRDAGRLGEAADAYGLAIVTLGPQMGGLVAYYRLLRAEVLILAGREDEARHEIVAALPILERENLLPDALAAIALLRESLRRQKADPEALKALRMQIQKMREVEQ